MSLWICKSCKKLQAFNHTICAFCGGSCNVVTSIFPIREFIATEGPGWRFIFRGADARD